MRPHKREAVAVSATTDPRHVAPAQNQTVWWIIAILLAIIATALLTRSNTTFMPKAYGDSPMMGGRGIFAFTGQIDRDRYGLFMMDVDNSTVWAYEYLPGTRRLRLAFARSFTFDRYLENFGNDDDSQPQMVKSMLEAQRQKKERDAKNSASSEDDGSLQTAIPGVSPTIENNK
jgi:hypothetical protein